MLKGGVLFRFKTPTDELFVEQILVSGAAVGKSENRKGNCFKVEKGGEKLVFMAQDNWDQATWIIQLEKWTGDGDSGIGSGSGSGSSLASSGTAETAVAVKPKRRFSLSKK